MVIALDPSDFKPLDEQPVTFRLDELDMDNLPPELAGRRRELEFMKTQTPAMARAQQAIVESEMFKLLTDSRKMAPTLQQLFQAASAFSQPHVQTTLRTTAALARRILAEKKARETQQLNFLRVIPHRPTMCCLHPHANRFQTVAAEPLALPRLSPTLQAVMDLLEGECLSADEIGKRLQLPLLGRADTARTRVGRIRKQLGDDAILQFPGIGYFRPDSPGQGAPIVS